MKNRKKSRNRKQKPPQRQIICAGRTRQRKAARDAASAAWRHFTRDFVFESNWEHLMQGRYGMGLSILLVPQRAGFMYRIGYKPSLLTEMNTLRLRYAFELYQEKTLPASMPAVLRHQIARLMFVLSDDAALYEKTVYGQAL